jgi:hypothetical protein
MPDIVERRAAVSNFLGFPSCPIGAGHLFALGDLCLAKADADTDEGKCAADGVIGV